MRVAVLGLGLMGVEIALRLQQQGFDVLGWNRSAAGRSAAARRGLEAGDRCDEVLRRCDVAVLSLSDFAAIESLLADEPCACAAPGRTFVQMGTIAPDESRALAAALGRLGADYLEAPVLGSLPEARAGTLIVMAGGPPALFQRCLPLLACLGTRPALVGPVGQAAALKLAMNQLIASLTAGFSLSLGLVRAEGLDVGQFMDLLRGSALYAPTFDKKLGKMLAGDYGRPNFPLRHLAKDVELFLRVAKLDGIDPSVPEALRDVLGRAALAGHAEDDYSSLYTAINPPRP